MLDKGGALLIRKVPRSGSTDHGPQECRFFLFFCLGRGQDLFGQACDLLKIIIFITDTLANGIDEPVEFFLAGDFHHAEVNKGGHGATNFGIPNQFCKLIHKNVSFTLQGMCCFDVSRQGPVSPVMTPRPCFRSWIP